MAKKLTMQIFADADYYIGLYYIEDFHHRACLRLIKSFGDEELITSWDVIDETAAKLYYFHQKNKALTFLNDLQRTKTIFIFPDSHLFSEAKKILQNQRSQHVSLTDCMNMAIMKEKGIKRVLSFDKIYEQNGFELVK